MFIDPNNQKDRCGLTGRQLLALARKNNWGRRRIYGRLWIAKSDFEAWLSDQKQTRLVVGESQ